MGINHASGYTEGKNGNKYLIFDSVDEKKSIKKDAGVWSGIKNKIKTINRDKRNWLKKRLHEN